MVDYIKDRAVTGLTWLEGSIQSEKWENRLQARSFLPCVLHFIIYLYWAPINTTHIHHTFV